MCALLLTFVLAGLLVYAYLDASASSAMTENQLVSGGGQSSQALAGVVGDTAPVPTIAASFTDLSLTATSVVVIDDTARTILYERNPDVQLPLASLTKVPLVLAALQALPPDSIVTVPYDIPGTSNTGSIPAGSVWRVSDIADFTLVGSSNGTADLLAQASDEPIRARFAQAPKGEAAVWLMNDIAHTHGGPNMYFVNPTGLDESATQSGGYGTARAVAALFAYAADTFPHAFSATTRAQVQIKSQAGAVVVANNTDEALDEIPGLVMGKTGFTDLAGGNLAVVFEVSGHRIIAVVLGSSKSGRFTDMRTLVRATQTTFAQ